VPASTISVAGASLVEGDAGSTMMNFTVSRAGDADSELTVSYKTVDGAALAGIDYTASSGRVTIPAWSTNATISVPVAGNKLIQANRSFSIQLTEVAPSANFNDSTALATETTPYAVIFGDLNGDGRADLAVANSGSNSVSVMLNATPASALAPAFAPPQTFATLLTPRGVSIGDVNGDGKADIVATGTDSNGVSVLINATPVGSALATFAPQQTFGTSLGPRSVAIGDLNKDGRADLVVGNQAAGTVSVLLNTAAPGDKTVSFTTQQTFATRTGPVALVVGDINSDGKPDLAVTNLTANSVSVLLNTMDNGAAAPSFALQQTLTTGPLPLSMAMGDLNGDGTLDFAVTNGSSNTLSVLLNHTAAGAMDIAFDPQTTFATGPTPRTLTAGDINGDGKLDLAIVSQTTGNVAILLNTATTQATPCFCSQQTFAAGAQPFATALGDVNGDGRLDLAVTNRDGSSVSMMINNTRLSATTPTASIVVAAAVGTIIDDDAPIATTTVLTATPNASTGGGLVTFTATVAPSPGVRGAVSFVDGGVPLPGGSNVALVNGVATLQVSALTPGAHTITATYSGAGAFQPSGSNALSFAVTGSAAPRVVSVVLNGNIPSLAGPQHSRIASAVVTFDQPVQLDAQAFALALHANVSNNGVLLSDGYGQLPTSLKASSADNKVWIVTFEGNTEDGADGLHSLKDGVYDLNVNAARVHPLASPGVAMAANLTTTFHRLFGDTNEPDDPSLGATGFYRAVVNAGDNFVFRGAFNYPANYDAALDFDGDHFVLSGDNFQFRTRFNKAITWQV
jgi:hypothetical protein